MADMQHPQDFSMVDELARELHEAGRAAVEAGLVVNKVPGPFLEWDQVTEHAREGRRVMARFLFGRGLVDVTELARLAKSRESGYSGPAFPLPPSDGKPDVE